MFRCSNVQMFKLLSERTSAVPPVTFLIWARWREDGWWQDMKHQCALQQDRWDPIRACASERELKYFRQGSWHWSWEEGGIQMSFPTMIIIAICLHHMPPPSERLSILKVLGLSKVLPKRWSGVKSSMFGWVRWKERGNKSVERCRWAFQSSLL